MVEKEEVLKLNDDCGSTCGVMRISVVPLYRVIEGESNGVGCEEIE